MEIDLSGGVKMKVLIAEDDPVFCRLIETKLVKWGYETVVTHNGIEAWEVLKREDAPPLAILDWMMPDMDGAEVCGKARESSQIRPAYIILLTAKDRSEDITKGLQAGADDYITKPFDDEEFQARIKVGVRVVRLQRLLSDRVTELEASLRRVKQLQGLLPICSYCKNIRNDQNYWQKVESYISEHTEVQFTHGICPECFQRIVEPELERLKKETPLSDL
ncbi:MAG: response regulator transcription factor [Thermodesulfobacteriota bacterium]|nr:response regulator transcription factor [Thermodesulfobacteriota bacterium]